MDHPWIIRYITSNEGFRRIRKLTEKGEEENIHRLKQQQTH